MQFRERLSEVLARAGVEGEPRLLTGRSRVQVLGREPNLLPHQLRWGLRFTEALRRPSGLLLFWPVFAGICALAVLGALLHDPRASPAAASSRPRALSLGLAGERSNRERLTGRERG